MAGNWSAWLGQIDRVETLETIVYLGAGYGADVPALVQTATRRIVLVEPNPAFQDALTAAAATDSRITVQPLALAHTAGSAPLQVFNFAAHSSLQMPGGLNDVFPGLRLEETPIIETVTLAALLNTFDLALDKIHVLIVDVPGEEAMILKQLADVDENPFAHLLICCTSRALYQNQPDMVALPGVLTASGYGTADVQRQDPIFPKYWMRRNPAQIDLEQLRATQEAQTEEWQDLQQAHDAQSDQLKQTEAALKSLTAEIEELRARQSGTADLERDLADARAAKQTLTARIAVLEETVQTLETKLEQASRRVEASQHDVAMALRMRALHDADMTDLRQRHAALVDQKNELEALLRQVTARLMMASEHLHQTEAARSELITEADR